MKKDCSTIRNEFRILHDGTAQAARPPFALDPAYVRVVEQTEADWIVFARDYALFLQYYDTNNNAVSDWTPFWKNNPATVLANLAAAKVDWFREETRLINIELQKLDNQADEPLLKQNFNRLFDAVATLALTLDQHIRQLPDDLPIKTSLRNLVQANLRPAFKRWIGWYKQANMLILPFPLLDTGINLLDPRVQKMKILGEEVQPMATVLLKDFSEDWFENAPDWASYVTSISEDSVVFKSDPLTPVAENINFAIRHFFFTNAFEQFLSGFAKASQESALALEGLLQRWNQHEPHFALFLAFIRLLGHERDYMNTLTERHLNFYYQRVLRLKEKPPTASQAFVTFELAKHVSSHLLLKNTRLKAGKDALGKEIFFALTDDFVPNKATVADLRTILKLPDNPAFYHNLNPDLLNYKTGDTARYFAAPVANSADGLGAELTSTNQQWRPFGNKRPDTSDQTWKIEIPAAEIGFAIASHYLYLTEGTRTITLTFNGNAALSVLHGKSFKILLTTEKGWHEVKLPATVNAGKLEWVVEGDAPAITPYDAKVHGGTFQTAYPLLKCILVDNDLSHQSDYEAIKTSGAVLQSISLKVDVVGKKKLALSGPTGPLDAGKPFHPFGAAPENGAAFFIGDKEVFQKHSSVTLSFIWKEKHSGIPYFTPIHPRTRFQSLQKGQWQTPVSGDILPHSTVNVSYSFTVDGDEIMPPDFSKNAPYANGDVAGFARFELTGDYGYRTYPFEFAKFMAGLRTAGDPGRLLDDQIVSVSLDYDATSVIELNAPYNTEERFYHLHPFGFEEIVPSASVTLLPYIVPQYSPLVGRDGGEWYIGVKDLVPPQTLSLLIQLAEGSADPLIEKPEKHVTWAYLNQNRWADFTPDQVADGTNGLLQSGIIRFSIPREANTEHTILPEGLHWLRASVQTAVDAVGSIVGVHAQAARVMLRDNGNDPQLNALPLPAGTIAKLVESETAIKKINQPYATFGGSAAETPAQFFTRVSERLRHKQRAITLWDYERMILEAFPAVHKVKCLNHVRFEQINGQSIYRELAPGHVTIIVISNLRNRNAVNRLRPYTSLGELKNIETFLRKHTTCFAKLHIKNPVFEPIQAEFKVKLFPGFDETFYRKLLEEEIIRFLSPWAYGDGNDIGFGGKVYKSALINFIEERPYVDYIEDFKLIHLILPAPPPNQEVIEPSKLCSILVSAETHLITVLPATNAPVTGEDCGCGVPVAMSGFVTAETGFFVNHH